MKSNAFYEPYPKYKSSGVKWLGNVPAHWSLVQLGRIGTFQKCSGGTKADEVPEGIPCVRYGDLYTSHRTFVEHTRSFITEGKAGEYTPVKYGDILFAGSGETIDEIGISAVNLIESQLRGGGDIILFRPQLQMDARFSGYLLDSSQSRLQKSCMGRGITVMHVYASELKYLWLSIPPLDEQTAIVRYLDYADERISRAISAKERLIDLLTEQRQAVINRAVTRGLDPNVPLKDSGVEWLGDVPEHWRAGKLRQILKNTTVRNRPDLPLLSVVREKGVTLRNIEDREENHNFIPDDLSNYKVVEVGQLAMNKMKAWQGSFGVSQFNGIVSPAYFIFDVKGVHSEFFHRAIRSKAYVPFFTQASDGVRIGQWDLSQERMREITFFIPPLDEQSAIVRYLDKVTSEIDDSIDNAQRQIDLLRECRTRLIADVVTGQVDVRDAVVN